jgi:hypothetical protein
MREERDTDKSRIYILQNDLGNGTKVGRTPLHTLRADVCAGTSKGL